MKLNKAIDNKALRTVGIVALAAGLLYYPATMLYKYIKAKRKEDAPSDEEESTIKSFAPSYRSKHKPHHRHAPQTNHNGTLA